jgi:formate--tetrahydrofolate ligase
VVLVATVRALKLHGGVKFKDLDGPNPEAVQRGLPNLTKHLENVAAFGKPAVVAINRFGADTEAEIAVVLEHCASLGVPCATSTHFAEGGAGAMALSRLVREAALGAPAGFQPLYQPSDSVPDKISAVASRIYGADGIRLTKKARRDLKDIERLGWAELPICVAKTQSSLSDDPRRRGRPEHFEVTVTRLVPNPGAGFIVVLTGDILRMPGLPRSPQAERIDLVDGVIVGVA